MSDVTRGRGDVSRRIDGGRGTQEASLKPGAIQVPGIAKCSALHVFGSARPHGALLPPRRFSTGQADESWPLVVVTQAGSPSGAM